MVRWIGFSDEDGYVKNPRRWNPKTSVALSVMAALNYPKQVLTAAEYISGPDGEPYESVMREAVTNRLCVMVEEATQSVWSRINAHVNLSGRASH